VLRRSESEPHEGRLGEDRVILLGVKPWKGKTQEGYVPRFGLNRRAGVADSVVVKTLEVRGSRAFVLFADVAFGRRSSVERRIVAHKHHEGCGVGDGVRPR
jgi:hypothetical protein